MPSSIQDVARLAGVSSATVSRVLSGKPHVRDNVKKRVLNAVKELNYRPSRVARSLRNRSSQIIGLIISDIQNPFFTALVRAVEDVASANDYAVFLCNSDEDVRKENLYIDLMLAENVAGVILTPTRETDSPSRKLVDAQIPVVSVDRRIDDMDVDTVVVDNVGGTRELVTCLIESGHQKIGAVLGSPLITTGRERHQGYREALTNYGIPYAPEWVRTGLPKEGLGYENTLALLALEEPPTAIFSGNNLLTIGVLRAIHDRGLQISKDISLVAFDDMEWTSLIKPGLTVASQPTYEMGKTAADLVLSRIADPDRKTRLVMLKPEIIRRGSVGELVITR